MSRNVHLQHLSNYVYMCDISMFTFGGRHNLDNDNDNEITLFRHTFIIYKIYFY